MPLYRFPSAAEPSSVDATAGIRPGGGLLLTSSLFNLAPVGKALLLVNIAEV